MGRPSKKTPACLNAILESLRAGNGLVASAELNAVTYPTLLAWRKEDDDFDLLVRQAMAQAESEAVAAVRQGFQDWRAAAFYLRNARRNEWHEKQSTEVDVTTGGQPLGRDVDWSRLSVDERRILLKALERQMDEDAPGGVGTPPAGAE